ncbi:hypothetical protein JCM11641_007011, partial [Rhodosporidiobolus odoratus]
MDAFRTLTGGSRFDTKRFKSDIQHFQPTKQPTASTSQAALPNELDFFAAEQPKTGQAQGNKKDKKRKRAAEAEAAPVAPAEPVDYPSLLRRHRIKLTGLDLPDPVASLGDAVSRAVAAGANENAAQLLAATWKECGLGEPTGIQCASWGVMLANRDVLACAPTGSGKTFSFIFPLLSLLAPSTPSASAPTSSPDSEPLRPRAVIIEPTRELAMQVLRETRRLAGEGGWVVKVLGEERVGMPEKKDESKRSKKRKAKAKEAELAEEVEKGEEDAEPEEVVAAGAAEEAATEKEVEEPYQGPIDVLITTPLRLVFALKSSLVSLSTTRHLVLDEADKLFELNFLEQTDEILAACAKDRKEGDEVRKGMFSATMPSSVEELAKGVMAGAGSGMVRAIVGHKEAATSTIDQTLHFVNTEDHKLLSLRTLISTGQFTPPVLIFVQSITRAKELSNELVFDGINADAIHAERTPQERDEVVRRFAKGEVWCLICTDVMARGVDFKGVKLVVNYDFPQSAGSYIHRIGRTGRAGKEGKAVTFFTKADSGHLKT